MKRLLFAGVLLGLMSADAQAAPRRADLAVQGVRATGQTVTFTVVNRGNKRSRKATIRIVVAGVTRTVAQRPLRARQRQQRSLTMQNLVAGTHGVKVCARPRADRRRRNDCATAQLTIPGTAPAAQQPAAATPPAPLVPTGPGTTTNQYVNAAHSNATDVPGFRPPLRTRWAVEAHATQVLAAGGRVFVTEKDRGVRALDPATGATLWSQPFPSSSAAYDNGLLFVSSSEGLRALDAATGAQRWIASGWSGPPTAADGELYVVVRGTVARVDQQTGARLWTTAPPQYWGEYDALVTLDATRVFAAPQCGALSRATGASVLRSERCSFPDYLIAPLGAGQVYYSGSDALQEVDTTTGAVVDRPETYPPAIAGNTIVIMRAGGLQAYELPAWTLRWTVPPPDYGESTARPPLIVGSHVYWAADDDRVRAYDLATGAQVWNAFVGFMWKHYQEPRAMAIGEGLLLVPTEGTLHAFEPA